MLEGTVLAENARMLDMCRELGFSIALDPDNPGHWTVQIDLTAAVQVSPVPA